MASFVDHLLFVSAAAALGGSSIRLAGSCATGLARVLVAATFAATAAVLIMLGCGLLALAKYPLAIAAATWIVSAAALLLPGGARPAASELAGWWRGVPAASRSSALALVGAIVGWIAYLIYRPWIPSDSITYHLTEVLAWVHNGSPGSIVHVDALFAVGNYPLANEVLLSWGVAMSHSWVFPIVWGPLSWGLALAALWLGFRLLDVRRGLALLGVAAVGTVPIALNVSASGAETDAVALTWLVSAGALCLASRSQPRCLIAMVLAAGLAIGTKTTAIPGAVIVLGIAAVVHRRALSRPAPAILAGCAASAIVGLTWYVRNLVAHGSPLWPFLATPWSDPVPPGIASYQSLLSAPGATLSGQWGGYASRLGGGIILLATPFVSLLLVRSRQLLAIAAFVLLSLLIWAASPLSGLSSYALLSVPLAQTRYLLPAIAAGALAACLVARYGRNAHVLAAGLLVGAAAWSTGQDIAGQFPSYFPFKPVGIGLLLGALLGRARAPSAWRRRERIAARRWPSAPGIRSATIVGGGALLAAVATFAMHGYLRRYAAAGTDFDAPLARWFAAHPGLAPASAPIAMGPRITALVSGDQLRHPVELIGLHDSCRSIERRQAVGWVVLESDFKGSVVPSYALQRCLQADPPVATVGQFRVYAPS